MKLQLGMLHILTIIAETIEIYVIMTKGKKNTMSKMFLGVLIASMLWSVSQLTIFLAEGNLQLIIAYLIGNIGICFIGTFWVNFALEYRKKTSPFFTFTTFAISGFFTLTMLTNRYHHLYYSFFGDGRKLYGILFYVNKYYAYFCVVMGMVFIMYRCTDKKEHVLQMLLLAVAFFPFGLNLLEHYEIIEADYTLTPLGFSVGCLMIFIAIDHYDFLDIDKQILKEVVEDIRDGVAIYDERGRLVFVNHEAEKLWGDVSMDKMEGFYGFLEEKDKKAGELRNQDEIVFHDKGRYLQIQKMVSLDNRKNILGTCFLFMDISRYYEAMEYNKKIATIEQKLAIEKEQGRLIQKVHDTLGHTLTMIQSLIKLGLNEQEEEKRNSYLEEAQGLSSNGIRELREYILQSRKENKGEFVTWYLEKLAKSVREVPVELQFMGQDCEKYSIHCDTAYSCAKEFITNSLRHANAGKIRIIVRFLEERMELFLFDDGVGCSNLHFGNGLNGIRDRVKGSSGEIRIISAENEGFQMYISMPVA